MWRHVDLRLPCLSFFFSIGNVPSLLKNTSALFEFLFSQLLYCFGGIIPEFLRDYFDEKISHAANISLVLDNE
jgi:hypothetical protein